MSLEKEGEETEKLRYLKKEDKMAGNNKWIGACALIIIISFFVIILAKFFGIIY